jgi:6-phosphogluconate dehydrogenase
MAAPTAVSRIGLVGLAVMGQVPFPADNHLAFKSAAFMHVPKTQCVSVFIIVWLAQNLALNIAEKGFPISVYNRSPDKVDHTVERAAAEGNLPVHGFKDPKAFVESIQKPR